MAVSDGTTYSANAFSLRGVEQTVTHTSGGKSVTRTAVVDISPTTFLDRGSARKRVPRPARFWKQSASILRTRSRYRTVNP